MKIVSDVLKIGMEVWHILLDSAFYIILGIVAAGCIKIYINQDFIIRHLRYGRYRSVIKASLFGIPLPL